MSTKLETTPNSSYGGWLARLLPARRSPFVPVVRLYGVIGNLGGLRGGGLSLNGIEESLARAFASKRAPAVALAINSPGGSPVQSALIGARIRRLAEEKNKKVYAFIEDVGASGGYWLAAAADEIYADASSIVGSIGVVSAGFGFAEAIQKLGVERRVYTAGTQKRMLDPFQAEDPEDVAMLKEMQADIHRHFIGYIRARRGERLIGSDDDLFTGRVWTGGQAITVGLIDGLHDLRGKLRELYGDKVRTPVVNRGRRSLLSRLSPVSHSSLDARAWLSTLEERAHWQRFGL